MRFSRAGMPWRATWRLLCVAAFAMVCAAASAASPDRGQDLYAKHCAHCHGATGRAVFPGTPDFKRTPVLLRPDAQLIASIRRGKGVMPAYDGLLRERELLDLVAYLRTLN
jgi:cytochrome c6